MEQCRIKSYVCVVLVRTCGHLIASEKERCTKVFRDEAWNVWDAELQGGHYLVMVDREDDGDDFKGADETFPFPFIEREILKE